MVQDPTFYYLNDNQISRNHYRGNTVPGTNTIDSNTNLARKKTTTRIIHMFLSIKISDGAQDDDYGLLNQWALEIYGRIKDGNISGVSMETVKVGKETMTKDEWYAEMYYKLSGDVPFAAMDQITGVFK